MDTIRKSEPIKIKNKNIKEKYNDDFYLNSNCFDPTKFSPPNEFIMKLNIRMEYYNNLRSRLSE